MTIKFIQIAVLALVIPMAACTAWSKCQVDSDTGECLPVTPIGIPSPQPTQEQPPSLFQLRQFKQYPSTPQPNASPMPTPSGVGGGTIYEPFTLSAVNGSEFETTMFVHPEGLSATTGGLEWLFTTSTNRTQMGVEVVGIYHEQDANGSLGVFDWSCSATSPCNGPNGYQPEPSWVFTSNFNNFACNISSITDPAGRKHKMMQYTNQTTRLKIATKTTPATWKNTVMLKNFCKSRYDQVWSHEYVANQIDCNEGFFCGWWGPILETIPASNGEPIPEISEVGFEHSLLMHNGIISFLPPRQTQFNSIQAPWRLFWLDPNQGYGAGSF